MNVKEMRQIDQYAGGLICLMLEGIEQIRRLLGGAAPPATEKVEKVLISKYLGMGSILLATPMLKALRARYPACRIVIITFEGNAEFTRLMPLIDEVIVIRTASFPLFAKDLFSALRRIRRESFDCFFDLEFFSRFSTILSYLSGAKRRVGYYLPKMWRGNLLTDHIHFNPHKHVTEVLAAQLAPLGIHVTDFSLAPPKIDPAAVGEMKRLLEGEGIKGGDALICVNVNASDLCRERKWPKENFVRLIAYIASRNDEARIILVGAKAEVSYVKAVCSLIPDDIRTRVTDLSGRLAMPAFVALLSESRLLITNDSGPLHIAASLGISTLSFFGPESPDFYGPSGKQNRVFYSGIYCSPCLNVYNAKTAMCRGDNRCMKEIDPEAVIRAMEEERLI